MKLKSPDLSSVLVDNREQFLGFIASRIDSTSDAEDVLQDFCVRAITHQKQLKRNESMVAWLYSVLRSTIADYYRKLGRQGRLKQSYQQQTAALVEHFSTEESFASFCQCMHGLLPALRPDQAELLQKLDITDGDRAEVATELGITTGALAVRLHRARQAIRTAMLNSCTGCLTHGFDDCS